MADGSQVFEHIAFERRGQVALLTLNNPERLNALSSSMRDEVEGVLAEVRADDGLRALVLTGASCGFSVGADLSNMRDDGGRPGLVGQTTAELMLTVSNPRSRTSRACRFPW